MKAFIFILDNPEPRNSQNPVKTRATQVERRRRWRFTPCFQDGGSARSCLERAQCHTSRVSPSWGEGRNTSEGGERTSAPDLLVVDLGELLVVLLAVVGLVVELKGPAGLGSVTDALVESLEDGLVGGCGRKGSAPRLSCGGRRGNKRTLELGGPVKSTTAGLVERDGLESVSRKGGCTAG